MTARSVIVNAPNAEALLELISALMEMCDAIEAFGVAAHTPAGEKLAAMANKQKEKAARLLPELRGRVR